MMNFSRCYLTKSLEVWHIGWSWTSQSFSRSSILSYHKQQSMSCLWFVFAVEFQLEFELEVAHLNTWLLFKSLSKSSSLQLMIFRRLNYPKRQIDLWSRMDKWLPLLNVIFSWDHLHRKSSWLCQYAMLKKHYCLHFWQSLTCTTRKGQHSKQMNHPCFKIPSDH